MPLALSIGFVTEDEPPLSDSLTTPANVEEELGFECSVLPTLRTLPGLVRQKSSRSELLSPFELLQGPCRLD